MKVFIDWGEISEPNEFYSQLLPQLEAPQCHGLNLDALRDSLVTGSINKIEPPFCVINTNVDLIADELQGFFNAVKEIYEEANLVGRKIRVFSE